MHAESAYLFRHALLHDAAYELQPPADRGRLHGIVLRIVEDVLAGDEQALSASAVELAQHARHAAEAEADTAAREAFCQAEVAHLHRAVEWCRSRGQPHEGAQLCRRLATHESAAAATRLVALRFGGDFLLQAGRPAEALPMWEDALRLARNEGDARTAAHVLGLLGIHAFETGDHAAADEQFQTALQAQTEAGDEDAAARTLAQLGNIHVARREYDRAEDCFRRSLKRATDRTRIGAVMGELAMMHTLRGAYAEAEQAFVAALDVLRERGALRGEGIVLGNMAILMRRTGRLKEASELYARALRLLRNVSHRRSEALVLYNSAEVLLDLARPDDALRALGEALEIFLEVGNPRYAGETLAAIAAVELTLGRATAGDYFRRAIALHQRSGNLRSQAFAHAGLCVCFERNGDTHAAETELAAAQAVAASLPGVPAELEVRLHGFRQTDGRAVT